MLLFLFIFQIPLVHLVHPFLYVYFVMPSQFMQFGHISQFAHGSVRFLRIECNTAFISRFLYYQMRQVGNGYFFSRADVDVAVAYLFCAGTVSIFKVHMLHDENTGIRHLLTP